MANSIPNVQEVSEVTDQQWLPDGSAALPAAVFKSEKSTGWYRSAAGEWALSILGVLRAKFKSAAPATVYPTFVLGPLTKFVQFRSATTLTAGSGQTITAAAIAGGIIYHDPGGNVNDTTDTAAAIIALLDLDNDGDYYECDLYNLANGAEAITIVGGTGVTVANATQTIGQDQSATLGFLRTSATTLTVHVRGA